MSKKVDSPTDVGATEAQALPDEEVEELELLRALTRLDLEAALAYEAAAQLDAPDLHQTLLRFRDDHLRHVDKLNELIRKRGGKSVKKRGEGDLLLSSLAGMAMHLGVPAVVASLLTTEQLTNNAYELALEFDWEDEIIELLEQNSADEQRHLEFFVEKEEQLAEEPEQPGASV